MDKEKRVKDNKEYIEGMVQGVYYTHKAWFTMEPTEIKDDIDRPITKKMEDGRYIYRDREGKEINTNADDLEDIISLVLEPLKYFFEKMIINNEGKGEDAEAGIIGQALLERAEDKIHGAFRFVDKHFGKIEIEYTTYHQSVSPLTKLGVIFKPVERGE